MASHMARGISRTLVTVAAVKARRGTRFAGYLGATLCASGGVLLYAACSQNVSAAQKVSTIDTSQFMAAPVTDLSDLEKNKEDMKAKMELLIMRIQSEFCKALEGEESSGTKFTVDRWRRHNPNEGGGITCVMQDGETFEKAGVNITVMSAPLSKQLQASMRARGKELPDDKQFTFFAAGISSVIHPRNPHVPTIHFNYRYFEMQDEDGNNKHVSFETFCMGFVDFFDASFIPPQWWFGGGMDLTPYFLEEDDVRHFHSVLKSSCDRHDPFFLQVSGGVLEVSSLMTWKQRNQRTSSALSKTVPNRWFRPISHSVSSRRGKEPEPDSREAKLTEVLKNPKDWV